MYSKILIQCDLVVKTGMHIGGTNSFSAIGAVDSPVIRDAMSGHPIVPGSSLKGKIRTLLARSLSKSYENMPDFNQDDPTVLRLFGSADPVRRARLQFADAFVINEDRMKAIGLTEVKSENVINRITAVANPRQIERVNPGTRFGVKIVYDADDLATAETDLAMLAKGMKLLQLDYLGGHGSRGSGRVSFEHFEITFVGDELDLGKVRSFFDEVESYELFPSSTTV